MPAMPGSVSVAPSRLSAPKVSATFSASARFASSPHGPYSTNMKSDDEPEPDQARGDAHLDGVCAEIGADGPFLDHGQGRGQGAGAQQRREIARLLHREAAARSGPSRR